MGTGDRFEEPAVDIVVRLRSRAVAYGGRPNTATDLFDAADEIERLRRQVFETPPRCANGCNAPFGLRCSVCNTVNRDDRVVDVAARAIGFTPGTPGVIGSGLSEIIAYDKAATVLMALGVPLHLPASKLRAWGAGAVVHLGPGDVR